jgi:hypothetical protein
VHCRAVVGEVGRGEHGEEGNAYVELRHRHQDRQLEHEHGKKAGPVQ